MSKPVLKDAGGGRGLMKGQFKDIFGQECSIQTSSLATAHAIWLGVDKGIDSRNIIPNHKHGEMVEIHARMHIDRKIAEWLWPTLKHFAKTGELKIK